MSFSSDNSIQINQLPLSINLPKEQDELIKSLEQLYKRIANSVNTKEGSLYSLQELGNFQQFFTLNNPQQFRNVYRKVFDIIDLNGGNIAAGATATVAHNISGLSVPVHIYGTATNSDATIRYMPLPYASNAANRSIELYLTSTNVVVVNGSAQTALTQCYVVAEYLKN